MIATLQPHLDRVIARMRRICVILDISPFLTGDHVYHTDLPERELVIISAEDPRRIEIRPAASDPGDPTAHVDARELRLWSVHNDPNSCQFV